MSVFVSFAKGIKGISRNFLKLFSAYLHGLFKLIGFYAKERGMA